MPKKNQVPILVLVENIEHRWLAEYSSAFARRDWRAFGKLAQQAKGAGISSGDLYELTLQGYLFLGFPAAIEALGGLDGVVTLSKNKPERSLVLRVKKGRRTCRRIYREKYSALMQNLKQKSPELAEWVIEEGYGKVFSRPGTDLRLRELFSVGLLSATGFPKQLFAHLRGLLEMGEEPADLALLVRRASKRASRKVKGKIEKALKHFLAHRNAVWEAPVSSL